MLHIFSLGSIGLFEYLNQTVDLGAIKAEYLIKLENQKDAQQTYELIEKDLVLSIESAVLEYEEFLSSFEWRLEFTLFNSNFLICAIVTIIGISLFAFHIYVDRGKEIGVERALGITRVQCSFSFLLESFTILIFGSIVGLSIGLIYVSLYMYTIFMGNSIPPIVISYPWNFFIRFLLVISFFSSIGVLIPSYIASKTEISRILKIE